MLYNIKNNRLRYWQELDELGDRNHFDFELTPCACGSNRQKLVANTTRHRNKFDFVQCLNCGTLRINPYLTKPSINRYYEKTYGEVKRNSVPPEKLYKKQAKAGKLVFSLVEKFINKDSKILDFGAGAGGKMNELLVQGYEVYIKELDQNYFDYGVSRGLKPFDPNLKYDLVILSRIIEHMAEPVEFLNEVSQLLAPGGHIYIEVPLIENARDGYLLNEFHIAHKFYFTMLSLKYVVAKAGFEAVHTSRNLIIVRRYLDCNHTPRLTRSLDPALSAGCEVRKFGFWEIKNMRRLARQTINRAYLTNCLFTLKLKKESRSKN